jgi:hypothetical protein
MTEYAPEKQSWAQLVADVLHKLTTAANISWGGGDDWRKYRVVALEQLSLPNVDGKSQPLVIEKGGTAWLESVPAPDASAYQVSKSENGCHYDQLVPVKSVKVQNPGWSVPDHEVAPIMLLCYELFPYAALHAGLMLADTFFKGIASQRASTASGDGSVPWARFLGAKTTSKPPLIDLTAKYGRGDIIVFCDSGGDGFHTVTAAGETDHQGRPLVYSLASDDKMPSLLSLEKLVTGYQREVYTQVFTPRAPTG